LTHWETDRIAGLEEFLCARQIEIPIPLVRLGLVVFRLVGGKNVAQINAGVFLVKINTRAARFHLAADRMRNTPPYAIYLGEILGRRTDRAILIDEVIDDIVDWLEHPADAPECSSRDVT
jgi:hypothetical protein